MTIQLKMYSKPKKKKSKLIIGICLSKDVFKSRKVFKRKIGFLLMMWCLFRQQQLLLYQVWNYLGTNQNYVFRICFSQKNQVFVNSIWRNINALKMFLKPIWEGKMHRVTKIGIFRPLFCVGMLGKSTNYSTGTRPLCSTFWAK